MNRQVKRYDTIKSRMIEKGTNLNLWAKEKGYPQSSVYAAARGTRGGIKAVKIQKELNAYAFGTPTD